MQPLHREKYTVSPTGVPFGVLDLTFIGTDLLFQLTSATAVNGYSNQSLTGPKSGKQIYKSLLRM